MRRIRTRPDDRPTRWSREGVAAGVMAASMILVAACGDVTAPTVSLGDDADEEDEENDEEAEGDDEPDTGGADAGEDVGPQDPDDADGEPDEAPQDDPTEPDDADGEPDGEAAQGELEIHFLDVGQADATLLRHDEVTVLIDTGHWQRSDVLDHLDDLGVEQLDLVVVTHPHADHVGQFDQVLERYDVDEVWWSGSETTTQTFGRALDALEASDAAYEEPRAGDTTTLGPLEVEVVNPPEGVDLGDVHDANLAMRITFGEVRLLVTGDAEAATEERMVDQADGALAADVLQLGHHGSSTSTTPGFLETVDPELAVYSAGEGNTYGHPHAEVLDRLDAAGVAVHGTDVDGTVVVTSDGASWSVTTEHGG